MRPSGTEDVLRLYVEAEDLKEVDLIANQILTEVDSKYRLWHLSGILELI